VLDELKRNGDLYQDAIVREIAKKFGRQPVDIHQRQWQ
jgi:hypothetical protein